MLTPSNYFSCTEDHSKRGVVVHACNLSSLELRQKVLEFEDSLGVMVWSRLHIILSPKRKKKKKQQQ